MNTAGTGLRFRWILRSEWTKLWSVRSTPYALLLLSTLTIGFSVLFCLGSAANFSEFSSKQRAAFDPTEVSLAGLVIGQLGAAVLGVLVISTEYATGSIKSTLSATPDRLRVLAAKTVIVTATAALVGLATCVVSFSLGQVVLGSEHLDASFTDPHVIRAVLGGGLYLGASAALGVALGTVCRQTATGIVAAVAGLLVLPQLAGLLPGSTGKGIAAWLTTNAGHQITTIKQGVDEAGPWTGYLVYCLWAIAILVLGALLLERRDA